ncbi:MAG: hypothetical protein OXI23_14780 [Gemmatimonadota bacterium]|nr:hypothetical protein [Gemmatimonadota bacterium]
MGIVARIWETPQCSRATGKPPVCLAAYSAAGIAGANPLRTGFESWRIAKGIYFIPLLFCYTSILFEGETWHVIETAIAALLGLLCFAAASEGFHMVSLGVIYRVLFLVAAVLLLWPFQEIVSFLKIAQVFDNAENWNLFGHAIGGAILLVLMLVQKRVAT